jgi:hypothetical protein
MKKLYLDDIRYPSKSDGWDIVRSYNQFVDYIQKNGLPDLISFDHDLASYTPDIERRELTGYDCAKWLCQYCHDNGLPLPEWNVHSGNPVGVINISQLLKNFQKKFG